MSIQAGDMVMAVRGHECVLDKIGGMPFRVRKIVAQHGGGWMCPVCCQYDIAPDAKLGAQLDGLHGIGDDTTGIPVNWLRRIPPLSELEGQRTQEEMKEPA